MRRFHWLALAAALLAPGGATFAQAPHAAVTIQNLQKATRAEAEAAQRYAIFAVRAEQEGYGQIAKLFRAAAESERIHRRNHEAVLRSLGASAMVTPLEAVPVGTTRENLRVPIEGERDEATETYPAFLRDAQREGIAAAVRSFGYARDTEAQHQVLFREALAQLGRNPSVDYLVNAETGLLAMQVPGRSVPVTATPAPAAGAQPQGQPAARPTR